MSFAQALILHVMAGLIGLGASYGFLLNLIGRHPSERFLQKSAWTALIFYVLSWISGGYYYVLRYGPEVKPLVKAGGQPWAHTFIMEAKEHVFLFLPISAFVLIAALWALGPALYTTKQLRNSAIIIAVVMVLIGTFAALGGMVISGSAA